MTDKKLNIKVTTTGASKSQKNLKGLSGSIKTLGKAALATGAAYFGARGLINGLKQSILLSAKMEGLRTGFDNLAKSAGFSAQTFSKLQKATDGTMGSMELMTQANNAMLLGIFDSEDQMAKMFDTAQRLAQALGKDAAFGVESLITGMGRQSKLMLDNLGIMVKAEDAYKRFADELNKTVSELTDQERKQAFVNEAMKEANKLVKNLGEEQLTTADAISKAGTAVDDLAEAIGERLAPLTRVLAENFTDFVNQLTALADKDIEFIGPILSDDVIALKEFRENLDGMSLEQLIFEMEFVNGQLINMSSESVGFDLLTSQANAAGYEVAALVQNIKLAGDAEIDFGQKIETVSTAHIDYLVNAGKLKREQLTQDLKSAALSGQTAIQAMKSVVRAETMEAVAGYLASVLKTVPFPGNLILAAAGGGVVAGLMDKALGSIPNKFATGADFVTSGATPMLVGESGPERVSVTPLTPGMNKNGPGGITLNIQGNMIGNESFVRDILIPEISNAQRMNLA